MKVCLSCYQAQAAGGHYCTGCGRTFGVKLCESKHINSPSPHVRCCSQCGSTQMTEPTKFLDVTFLPLLLTGLIALGLWRWAIGHLPLLGNILERLALMTLAVLLDTTPCRVLWGIDQTLSWALTLWGLGWGLTVVPGRGGAAGNWLRALPALLGKTAWRAGHALLRLAGRGSRRVLWPSPRKAGPPGKEKSE